MALRQTTVFNIVLYQPEIAPNTGNIIRLCANTGANLHLIKPLGFSPTDAKLKRAGLDYHDWAQVTIHDDFATFVHNIQPKRIFVCETGAHQHYTKPKYQQEDSFIFGPETRGLPTEFLNNFSLPEKICIPMRTEARSLNLSNAVAIVIFEAWRQLGFL